MADVDQSLTITDPVTGAYSRALLSVRVESELARATRNQTACALFLFDVDYFKSINDSYGHQRGDEILRQLAQRVDKLSRSSDELFRYGGDEFVLLLPDTARADAVQVAMAVVEGIRGQDFPGTPPLQVSVSLGVAMFPTDGGDLATLLACADRRNYLAKGRGRACVVADDVDTTVTATSSRLLEREIALAAVNDLLTRLESSELGVLAVLGGPGAGHTRFLDEAGRIARLRGFHVVHEAPGDNTTPGAERVMVVADRETGPEAMRLVAQWQSVARTVGVVYADLGGTESAEIVAALGEPAAQTAVSVELPPWSAGALRIWLRSTLRGEPSATLVTYLYDRTGGLPGLVLRELELLRTRDCLEQLPDGRWSVTAEALGRARPWSALPVSMTTLVGRTAERDRVVAMLRDARLVTLAGPGGIGKTRLSLAVAGVLAGRFADGAVFVALAELERAELVIEAIAEAVGADPVTEAGPLDAVVERLTGLRLLLVLDNFEQVLDAALAVGELLRRLPDLRVLTTSRERLSLYGERVFQVPPLPLPAVGELPQGPDAVERALAEYPALALFAQQATAVDADFCLVTDHLAAVAEICRRLDGLPLAIELAAARVDRWSPRELLTHLAMHLDALPEGPRDLPARQRTLRGVIDWSINLLTPPDRVLFAELAVFTGGCTMAAAAAVVGSPAHDTAALGPRLIGLVDKNLLVTVVSENGAMRFSMLETVRTYALEQLHEAQQVFARHCVHFGDLVEQAAELIMGPDRARWAGIVEREYANLRTAFETAMGSGDTAAAMRICRGLWHYWADSRHLTEGREWCARLLAGWAPSDSPDDAELLYIAAVLAHHQDDHDAAQMLAERCLGRMLELGDRLGAGRARSALGMAAFSRGEYDLAIEHHGHSLADWRELGFARGVAVALGNLTRAALRLGDVAGADAYIRERLALSTDDNPRDRLLGLEERAELALLCGDPGAAREFLAVSLPLSRELKDTAGGILATHQLGLAAALEGARTEALRLLIDALGGRHAMNLHEDVAISLECVAREVAIGGADAVRDATSAAELLGAAIAVRERHHLPSPPSMRPVQDAATLVARTSLGEVAFARAVAAGRAAPLEQVLDRVREA